MDSKILKAILFIVFFLIFFGIIYFFIPNIPIAAFGALIGLFIIK